MAHPTGVQLSNDNRRKEGLTGAFPATEIRREHFPMANRSGAPPGEERKAPASAGTDARADLSMRTDRRADHSPARAGAQSFDRYDAALAVMVPIREPDNIRKLRKRLMAARDQATRGLCNPGAHMGETLSLYHVIVNVASAYVYRFGDLDGLEDAADSCLRLLMVSSTLDRMGGAQ